MKKKSISLSYILLHPLRVVEIINRYRLLKGRYRFAIIFAHIYKEAFYRKKYFEQSTHKNFKILCKENIHNEQQVIINIHDGLLHSGGLTDRLKGICTLYMFAKKENFNFKIFFVHPFNLEKYMVPNDYDWTMEESFLSYNLETTAIYTWENEKMAKNFFKSNKDKNQLHISCNSWECIPQYSELFNELFKPSHFLKSEIDLHTKILGGSGNYISISFRFQNLFGEFKEANSTALNESKRNILIKKCLGAINDLKEKFSDTVTFLVTSDSNMFRDMVTNKFNYVYTYILPEEEGHIDYAEVGKSKELTAFLDMFLIAGAKKAFQVRSLEMYNSDFPNMAAKINNIPYEMILID